MKVPFDQDMDRFDAESNSKSFEDVDTSEMVAMELGGAAFNAEISEMKMLRHAL